MGCATSQLKKPYQGGRGDWLWQMQRRGPACWELGIDQGFSNTEVSNLTLNKNCFAVEEEEKLK